MREHLILIPVGDNLGCLFKAREANIGPNLLARSFQGLSSLTVESLLNVENTVMVFWIGAIDCLILHSLKEILRLPLRVLITPFGLLGYPTFEGAIVALFGRGLLA